MPLPTISLSYYSLFDLFYGYKPLKEVEAFFILSQNAFIGLFELLGAFQVQV